MLVFYSLNRFIEKGVRRGHGYWNRSKSRL